MPRIHTLALSVLSALGVALGATTALAAQEYGATRADTQRHEPANTMRHHPLDVRMSKLVGKSVEDRAGERLGEVEDLIVDTHKGKVSYAVLSLGGFLDIGNRLVSVPLSKLQASDDGDRLILIHDPASLQSFESFERDRWPELNRGGLRATLDNPRGATRDRFRRASHLLDIKLEDAQGKNVGHVEDIVVDLGSGKVRYAVAEFDPSWYQYGKLVMLPVKDIHARDRERDDLVMVVDRSKLRYAPAFSRARWPDLNEREFRGRADSFLSMR